jgi:hypothetical protein
VLAVKEAVDWMDPRALQTARDGATSCAAALRAGAAALRPAATVQALPAAQWDAQGEPAAMRLRAAVVALPGAIDAARRALKARRPPPAELRAERPPGLSPGGDEPPAAL